jgi:formylglycine-generating enzyme required for sulfatase activity
MKARHALIGIAGLAPIGVACTLHIADVVSDTDSGQADGASDAVTKDVDTIECPSGKGPEMVPVRSAAGTFCIDSTEVTEGQYRAFSALQDAQWPDACDWNAGEVRPNPESWGDAAAVQVNWCQAAAFCTWAGKRLCGKIGGGPTPPGERTLATSQWFAACSGGGANVYPYGANFDPIACNTAGVEGGVVSVASFPRCRAGDAAIFDLSGNLAEWEDSCDSNTDDAGVRADMCYVRGGAYLSGADDAWCNLGRGIAWGRRDDNYFTGIRCCSP